MLFKRILTGLAIITITACGGDEDKDSKPLRLTLESVSRHTVSISWTSSKNLLSPEYWVDPLLGPYRFRVYRDGVFETEVTSFTQTARTRVEGLEDSRRYCFDVRMKNEAGKIEVASNRLCVETTADGAPSTPNGLSAAVISPGQVDLSWNPSSDDFGYINYNLYRDGERITRLSDRSWSDLTASPATTHCYRVSAIDSESNESGQSNESCVTTPADLTPPTEPGGLYADYVSSYTNKYMKLTWALSTDDGVVRYYEVHRNGTYIADAAADNYADDSRRYLRYDDYTVAAETGYCYFLVAVDAAGKKSTPSNRYCDTSSWISSWVDSGGYPMRASIAVDHSDFVHIGYQTTIYDPSTRTRSTQLKHIASDSATWLGSTLIDSGSQMAGPSLALDNNGGEHIAYGFLYADKLSGNWQVEHFIPNWSDLDSVSLKIDSNGTAHLCYADYYQLRYANNRNGSWTVTDIGAAKSSPDSFYCALALDSTDQVHISYRDSSSDQLLYASNTSGGFTTQVIDAAAPDVLGTSIAVDSLGKVHISYHDNGGGQDLKYASNSSGGWVVRTLDSDGDVGKGSALAIDLAGKIHISYGDAGNEQLKYASNASGTWQYYTIDFASMWPTTSIAVDSTGKIHISHSSSGAIRHSTNRDYN